MLHILQANGDMPASGCPLVSTTCPLIACMGARLTVTVSGAVTGKSIPSGVS